MHPAFQQFVELLKNKDYTGIETLLSSQFDRKELATLQCVTCGKILGLTEYPDVLTLGIRGGDAGLQLLVFKHLQVYPDHEVVMKTSIHDYYPLGEMYIDAMRKGARMHGITMDEAFKLRIPYLEGKIRI